MDLDDFEEFTLHQIEQLPLQAEQIAAETRKDPDLGKLVKLLESGQLLERNGYKLPEAKYSLSSGCLLLE